MSRAIGVTSPLKWPSICTRSRVKAVLLMTSLWSVFLNVPFMLELEIAEIWDLTANVSRLDAVPTEWSTGYFHTEVRQAG